MGYPNSSEGLKRIDTVCEMRDRTRQLDDIIDDDVRPARFHFVLGGGTPRDTDCIHVGGSSGFYIVW